MIIKEKQCTNINSPPPPQIPLKFLDLIELKRDEILCFNTYNFNKSELPTTETELNAIAADAIQGWRVNPSGLNIPAAIGIPSKL